MPLSGLGCCCHIWYNPSLLAFVSRSTLITWSSLCDFSIWICLWIPSYTDYMVLSLWSFNVYVLVNSVIHWSHGSFIVIFQSVFACEFRDTLLAWFSHCNLSISPWLWIPWYTDRMVLSLWSFNLSLLVNSVIHWSHGFLFVIFQSVFACEFRYTLITWPSLCDLSLVTMSESLFVIITLGV